MKKSYAIVPLRGGFGNQLFCWAYGSGLRARGAHVVFDTGKDLGRGFALPGLIHPRETCSLPSRFWRSRASLSRLLKVIPSASWVLEDETKPPRIVDLEDTFSLHWGYWQSHDYFQLISDEIHDQLSAWIGWDNISTQQQCAIHVRRGDYVSDPGAAAVLGAQPLSYYESGLSQMRARGFEKFVVYTDDRSWAAEHLVQKDVQLAPPGAAMDDFLGLASSAGIIMSNSSFSWWAAFLASRIGAPIIGPSGWFADAQYDSSRLMKDEWIRI